MRALYGGACGRASAPTRPDGRDGFACRLSRVGSARYTRPVTRTYIAVVFVEVLVLAALWLLSQHFAA